MIESGTGSRIILMTDFGTEDTYVGVMKGVIASIAPNAFVQDLTHAIPQGNIRQAAYKLWQSVRYFPAGSIFVVVVDPGVGTRRKAVVASWGDYFIIAPDNGVLSYLLAMEPFRAAHELTNKDLQWRPVSTTFHGRDIFAPAGAYLAVGRNLEEFGPTLNELDLLELPALRLDGKGQLVGEVVHLDHFGNAITSIGHLAPDNGALHLDAWLNQLEPTILMGDFGVTLDSGLQLAISSTFGAVGMGEPVAYIGSERLLEVAINRGSAAAHLGLEIGSTVRLTTRG